MNPKTVLERQKIPAEFLNQQWRSMSRNGHDIWRATVRYLPPAHVLALAHLAADGWAVSIDRDRDATDRLLITIQKGTK